MVGDRASVEVIHGPPTGSVEEEDALVQADVIAVSGYQGASEVHDGATIFTCDRCVRDVFISVNTWFRAGSGIPGGLSREGKQLTVTAAES